MDIQYLKRLHNRQIVCLILALAPIGSIVLATGLFSWSWFLFIIGAGVLLLEKLLLSHWAAQAIGDPRANKASSFKKRNWAKVFWFVNFLFLFGGWEIISLEYLIIVPYWFGYVFFQYWGFKLIFRGKK
jgi:hypothetical protein